MSFTLYQYTSILQLWILTLSKAIFFFFPILTRRTSFAVFPFLAIFRMHHVIWKRISIILGIPPSRIDVDASFTQLGGNSLSALLFIAACRRQNLNLTVRLVLSNIPISDLVHQNVPNVKPHDNSKGLCNRLSTGKSSYDSLHQFGFEAGFSKIAELRPAWHATPWKRPLTRCSSHSYTVTRMSLEPT